MSNPLLRIQDLKVHFDTDDGVLHAVDGVNFHIDRSETLGVVGESGCGKSVTAMTIMKLLAMPPGRIANGQIWFEGQDLVQADAQAMRSLRAKEIAMIFQEPMSALDPVFTVGEQISEGFRSHFPERAHEARERAIDMLAKVGIPLPERRYHEYPHQLSGGMRQRVMIAMALICEPALLVADEPTTALDVTVQAQIIALLSELSERTGTALLFITHDLGVVAETCTRMVTMYAGEVVEDAPVDDALVKPLHPYTSGLLGSLPGHAERHSRLVSIPGRVPSPDQMPEGCRFQPRCSHARDVCLQVQPLQDEELRRVRCIRSAELSLPGVLCHA